MEQALAGPNFDLDPASAVAEQGHPKLDGRRARGARTRDTIVSALMELIAEGDVAPTAQRIADRAGVSVRSVYQHFTDVEGLYADASARAFEWIRAASPEVDPTWPLQRRIDEFALNRSKTLEELSPFSRAARLIEPTSEVVRNSRLAMVRWGRDRIAEVFAPEIYRVSGADRSTLLAAVDSVTSADAWEHLRSCGHSVASARRVLRFSLIALLASVPD